MTPVRSDTVHDLLRHPTVRHLAGALAITMLLAIYILGSYPRVVEDVVVVWDKAVHFTAYGSIAAFFLIWRRVPWQAVALSTLGGALDELHQLFVPGRSAGLDDLSADFLGALTVCVLATLLWRRRAIRSRP